MIELDISEIEEILLRARYKVLVAIRPLASAREAYNLVVAEFVQDLRNTQDDVTADAFRERLTLSAQEDKFRTKVIG